MSFSKAIPFLFFFFSSVKWEGDSFPTIQHGSGKTSYLWKLADWVEKVQDISFFLMVRCKIFQGSWVPYFIIY